VPGRRIDNGLGLAQIAVEFLDMRPLLNPVLVNGRSGDPALYVDVVFAKRAVLIDLGSIEALPPRKILRLEHVFVSHTHIDHFFGFDRLLRTLVGRDHTVHLYGPQGFIDHVGHKLQAYSWNLAKRYPCDLVFVVTEVHAGSHGHIARFRLKNAFLREPIGDARFLAGVLHREPNFRVATAVLDHRLPCLGFAVEEPIHVNVWKTRLEARGLAVGPWLRELKRAVIEGYGDDHPIDIGPNAPGHGGVPLGELRDLVSVSRGQKLGYVTDVADTDANRQAIVQLVADADILFIEACFRAADAPLAARRAHLTTTAAGELAAAAKVRRVEPFHFSARYEGEETAMMAEVAEAFSGEKSAAVHYCEG
jgi:ribonuclease Z